MRPNPRIGSGVLVSRADVRERVKEGLLAWKHLTCEHEFVTIIDRKKYSVKECGKCKKIEKEWK